MSQELANQILEEYGYAQYRLENDYEESIYDHSQLATVALIAFARHKDKCFIAGEILEIMAEWESRALMEKQSPVEFVLNKPDFHNMWTVIDEPKEEFIARVQRIYDECSVYKQRFHLTGEDQNMDFLFDILGKAYQCLFPAQAQYVKELFGIENLI